MQSKYRGKGFGLMRCYSSFNGSIRSAVGASRKLIWGREQNGEIFQIRRFLFLLPRKLVFHAAAAATAAADPWILSR